MNLNEVEISVQDFPRGHEHGADDRVIREVVLTHNEKTVGVHRFAANWKPRSFRVEPGRREWDYILTYTVSDNTERAGNCGMFQS